MREVVGSITGIFMALYFMYFMIPLLNTSHTNFGILVNATDPTIATSYTLGSGFYMVIPLIPLFVGAFVLINMALKRDAGE
jgi:hypothetical protein